MATKAVTKTPSIPENGVAQPVDNTAGAQLSDTLDQATDGVNPVEVPEPTAEEHEAAGLKAAVEASGIFHLNTLFNQLLKTAQKADDAIKNDLRKELWTLPDIEKLFYSLRGHKVPTQTTQPAAVDTTTVKQSQVVDGATLASAK